jgi:hypothetical protein
MVLNHFRNPTLGAFVITVLVVSIVELAEFSSLGGAAKGQANQNAAMCDPNDKSINATESRICGVPKTTGSSAENSTATNTGTTTPPSPSDNTTTQGGVPGVIP